MFQTQKFITSMQYIAIRSHLSVHAKPRLSQVIVRQNFSAHERNFEFTCHNLILLCIQWCDR